ncbi:ABC transporter permease subunit [Rhodobacter sp. 24-YEA-8]|uniref:ABC transporter permease subunit n=1 Tax=Rhodobacter sp. 24-YEA-8 TaxID=1884310 RepID=UPI00344DFC68
MLIELLPNAFGPIAVLATIEAGWSILSISALSFLGFGAPVPAPEWGLLIATGRDYLGTVWWVAIILGLAVAISVIALNTIAAPSLNGGRNDRYVVAARRRDPRPDAWLSHPSGAGGGAA